MKSKRKIVCYAAAFLFVTCYLIIITSITNIEVSVDGWGYNTTRETRQYVAASNVSAHILPSHFCENNAFLLMVICSAPGNFEARNAIRETWAKGVFYKGKNISHFFLLGETADKAIQNQVEMESEQFGDIVVERFIDSYNNLTLKSILMLKLVTQHCVNTTKYLLKIDDDMLMNTELLMNELLSRNKTTDLILGKLICGAKPIKDPSSKWYSPKYMYSGDVYPNYVSGTGYVMSVDVAEKLYKTALKTPIFHLEDVYLTGICAKKAKIKMQTNSFFTYHKIPYDICVIRKLITAHRWSPEKIRKTYLLLKDKNLQKECSLQNNVFNVNHWIFNNVLKVNKTLRKNKCE